jgi:hypothetical protein
MGLMLTDNAKIPVQPADVFRKTEFLNAILGIKRTPQIICYNFLSA